MRDQNGVEFFQESTGHVGFFLALLLANQWDTENPNFLVIWPTDKCEGSKWGGILPGIHWAFFLALLMAEIANERLKIIIFLLFDLKTSGRGQNGVEFNQESTGHALLLANERLNFARNPIIVVPDMYQISFYTCREWGLTNGYGHLSIYCFSAINKNNKMKYIF